MKKVIFIIVFTLSFVNAQSQNVIDIASKEIYDCSISKIKSVDNPTDKQIDEFLTICTRDIYNLRLKPILRYFRQTVADGETFSKFSDAVNERLANPNAPSVSANSDNATDEIFKPVMCTILTIDRSTAYNKYPTITGKDANGEMHQFIYLKPFPTDILYRYSRINPGDKFIISYEELDIFDESKNDFITYKYVTQLEKRGYIIPKEVAKEIINTTKTTSPTRKP